MEDSNQNANGADLKKEGSVKDVEFSENEEVRQTVSEGMPDQEVSDILQRVSDVPVTLSVEVGRRQMTIERLLQLGQGSVVDLERLAGEPVDVLINGILIARGEVVMGTDGRRWGVRISEVLSRPQRLRMLV